MILLLFLLSSDTLYTCNFSEFQPDWTAGSSWNWQGDGIELDMSVNLGSMSWMVQNMDTLLSPPIPVPQGWSGLTLVVENTWHAYGYSSSPCYSQTTSFIEASAAGWSDDLWSRWCQHYYNVTYTDPVIADIPQAQPGDTLSLCLWGWVYCTRLQGGGTATAELEWSIARLSILGNCVSMESDTWASVKALF